MLQSFQFDSTDIAPIRLGCWRMPHMEAMAIN